MNPQITYLLNLSIQQIESKRLDDAEHTLNQALKLNPNNAEVLSLLSVINAYRSDYLKALQYISKSIELDSSSSDAFNNMGNILKELERFDEAKAAYEKAIKLNPTNAQAYNNIGTIHNLQNSYSEAIYCYKKAISIMPNYAEAYSNLANVLTKTGLFEESLKMYQKAILIKPNYIDARLNRAIALNKFKKFTEALESCDEALLIDPFNPTAWTKKGVVFSENGFHEEALKYYDKAVNLNNNYGEAWACRGTSLIQLKKYEDALLAYEKAYQCNRKLSGLLGDLIHLKQLAASWNGLDEKISELIFGIEKNLILIEPLKFCAAKDSPELSQRVAKRWIESKCPPKDCLPRIEIQQHHKIRIAYFSADFKTHPVSLLTAELYELHNRDLFEVFAFSLKKADADDQLRDRLSKAFDMFIEVEDKTEIEVAQISRDMEIDIAIDLGGHTISSPTGIMSYRAAPIQINYLGYPGTLGAEYIDYIIADKTIIPDYFQQFYSEKIVYLPGSFMVDDSKRIPSNKIFQKKDFGLPDDKFIFCCFNNSFKYTRDMINHWAIILSLVPNSILWISENNDLFNKNIMTEFSRLGIGNERIIFASKVESINDHLARLKLADLFLDTYPYNAHTTALDSLKASVPILTLQGQAFQSRVSASLLNSLDLSELVTDSYEEYVQKALDLSLNPEQYSRIKTKLQFKNNSEIIFNTQNYVRNIELAYSHIYKKYICDLPTDNVYIN